MKTITEIIYSAFAPSVLACFALLTAAQGQLVPAPDGCYPNYTTAEGCNALNSLTTGTGNTGVGWYALSLNSFGSFNTAVGSGALALNSANANSSTAVGAGALLLNITGFENVAVGTSALVFNESGFDNNAIGAFALLNNTTGNFNNAHGRLALQANVDGSANNAFGDQALTSNTTGGNNSAIGSHTMNFNTTGSFNTAMGDSALEFCEDGNSNVAIGALAGEDIVHGSNIICIGAAVTGGGGPFADASNTCFIGSIFSRPVSDPGTQTAVYVDQFNVVGVFNSSRKYKHDIQPMDKASETLYSLEPVTFKFNSDQKGTTQYGLIAEEVAKVDSQLVVRKDGEMVTVRYEQINAMLLNEFLKEHRKVAEQDATITELKAELRATATRQQKQIDALTAGLQKVSAQLEASIPALQTVKNDD